MSPSPSRGADEELEVAIAALLIAYYEFTHGNPRVQYPEVEGARKSIESLFSRIREERDRLTKWGREGYQAHADSARALFATAYELGLEGVDDYTEVPKAAAALIEKLKRLSGSGLEKEEKTKNE